MARILIPFILLLVFTGCVNLEKRSPDHYETPERYDSRERADREPDSQSYTEDEGVFGFIKRDRRERARNQPRDNRIVQPEKTRRASSRQILPNEPARPTEPEIQWRPLRTDMEANRMLSQQPNPFIPSLSAVQSSPKRGVIPGSVYGPGSLAGITLNVDWQDMPAAMAYLDAFQRMKQQVPQIPYDSLRFDQAARLTDTVTLQTPSIQAADLFSFLDERSRCRTRFEERTIVVRPYF